MKGKLFLIVSLFMVIVLMLSFVGCKKATPTPTPTKTAAPPTATATTTALPTATSTPAKKILIGITEDASAFNADAGKAQRDAATLAIEEWNAKGGIKGTKIEYVIRDNAGDPTKATTIAKEFINMGITAAVMGTSSTVAIPEAKLFTEQRIPQVGGAASLEVYTEASDGKWYYFSGACANTVLAEAPFPNMAKKGYKKIASIISNVAWPQNLRDTAKQVIANKYGPQYGMELISDLAVDVNATDISTEVYKIKQLKPDAVLATLYPVNIGAYFSALRKVDWIPPAPSYGYWVLVESVFNSGEKKLLWGNVSPSHFSTSKPEFVKKKGEFMARFGYEPVGHFAFAYDSTNLLLRAINAVGTDAPAIRDYLETQSKGQPIICGRPGATANFTKESWHSLVGIEDFVFATVDKDGKLNWEE